MKKNILLGFCLVFVCFILNQDASSQIQIDRITLNNELSPKEPVTIEPQVLVLDNIEPLREQIINTGQTLNGCNVSVVLPPLTVLGYPTFHGSINVTIADFIGRFPEGNWRIDSVAVLAYQIGSTLESPITEMYVKIKYGVPWGSTIFGDFTTNRLARSSFSCIYRNSDYVNTERPVMENVARVGATVPGNVPLYLEVCLRGNVSPNVYIPTFTVGSLSGAWSDYGSGVYQRLRDGQYDQSIPRVVFAHQACGYDESPVVTLANAKYNGEPIQLVCGDLISMPHHSDTIEFDVTVTDADLGIGDTIRLSSGQFPDPECNRIEITPSLPISSPNPITVHVRVTRIGIAPPLCSSLLELIAGDKCNPSNLVSCRLTIDNPLPVSLNSFTSLVLKNDVKLHWSTSFEENNCGFAVERQNENATWVEVGFAEGMGNLSNLSSYEFIDRNLPTGIYHYRLKQIDFNGNFEYFDLPEAVTIGIPDKFFVDQNYPNPFNPATTIAFGIPQSGNVTLKIFDMAGREIKTLVNEFKDAGYYVAKFDGSSLASGTYIYRIESGSFVSAKKMLLLK